MQPKTYKTMKKFFIFCLIPLLFAGCKIRVEGPYSETVYVSLPQNHSAKVHFTRKNGKISTHLFLNKNKDLALTPIRRFRQVSGRQEDLCLLLAATDGL